jgi:AraC-like DNA-binding protein
LRTDNHYCAERYAINFVERGHFALKVSKQSWTVDERQLFVTAPGMKYRCRQIHRSDNATPGACLDVCFSGFGPAGFDEALVQALRDRAPVLELTNRRAYLHRRLTTHLDIGSDALTVESIAGELLHDALEPRRRHNRLFRPSQFEWYARRIDRARQTLDEQFASRHSLASLARTAAMSPFQFARIFRELTGVPPHRYLVQRRLSAAAERLRQGASATETCYAVGFSDLSHFTHAFRRVFGTPPGRFARERSAS